MSEIEVRVEPAVSGQAALCADRTPAAVANFRPASRSRPKGIVLPAPGIVQQYPFDSYSVSATVHANAKCAGTADAIATEASLFFRVPRWSDHRI